MTHPAKIPPRHPFADAIKLRVDEQGPGRSVCSVEIEPDLHHNPHLITHGAVLYALADTGMGVALYPTLAKGESCATIEIKMSYFRAVPSGVVRCETTLINRGRTIANLDSRLYVGDTLVAQANGNYAILKPRTEAAIAAS
ncbi:MAG: PaaI family thioesterase [Rhizobiales bacterium]|nr:PaaI family thioesterase [Hyphomicrobiales bacterium]